MSKGPFRTVEESKAEIAAKQELLKKEAKEKELENQTMADLIASEGLSAEDVEGITASSAPREPMKPPVESTHDAMRVEPSDTTKIDFKDLNETTLLKYPIEAKSLYEDAMVLLEPNDSSKVLRWCFYNNGVVYTNSQKVTAVNIGRYKNWGFNFATINDIKGGQEALNDSIVDDGGKIINYDTVLMIVDKIRLMAHYKKNLLQSMRTVDGALSRAKKTAEMEVAQTADYRKAVQTHPQAKIEFYSSQE